MSKKNKNKNRNPQTPIVKSESKVESVAAIVETTTPPVGSDASEFNGNAKEYLALAKEAESKPSDTEPATTPTTESPVADNVVEATTPVVESEAVSDTATESTVGKSESVASVETPPVIAESASDDSATPIAPESPVVEPQQASNDAPSVEPTTPSVDPVVEATPVVEAGKVESVSSIAPTTEKTKATTPPLTGTNDKKKKDRVVKPATESLNKLDAETKAKQASVAEKQAAAQSKADSKPSETTPPVVADQPTQTAIADPAPTVEPATTPTTESTVEPATPPDVQAIVESVAVNAKAFESLNPATLLIDSMSKARRTRIGSGNPKSGFLQTELYYTVDGVNRFAVKNNDLQRVKRADKNSEADHRDRMAVNAWMIAEWLDRRANDIVIIDTIRGLRNASQKDRDQFMAQLSQYKLGGRKTLAKDMRGFKTPLKFETLLALADAEYSASHTFIGIAEVIAGSPSTNNQQRELTDAERIAQAEADFAEASSKPEKRGRHVRDCTCDKCTAKRKPFDPTTPLTEKRSETPATLTIS